MLDILQDAIDLLEKAEDENLNARLANKKSKYKYLEDGHLLGRVHLRLFQEYVIADGGEIFNRD
jgi:hypothetical protein